MTYKLFVDDERNPPDDTWVVARSTQKAIETVTERGLPELMSLDHDLGMLEDGSEDKVMHFLAWLEEMAGPETMTPAYKVHSQNPVGRENILSFMAAWERSRSL